MVLNLYFKLKTNKTPEKKMDNSQRHWIKTENGFVLKKGILPDIFTLILSEPKDMKEQLGYSQYYYHVSLVVNDSCIMTNIVALDEHNNSFDCAHEEAINMVKAYFNKINYILDNLWKTT